AHAELIALREAARALGSERLTDCDLYVTLEPCTMCAAAISFARIRRLYYGALDRKGGAVDSGVRFYSQPTCHHRPEVYGGMGEVRAAALLKEFFAAKRWAYAPARRAKRIAVSASGRTASARAAACWFAAVPSRTRPTMPCTIAASRKKL